MSEQPTAAPMAFPPSSVPVVPHRAAPVGPLRHLLAAVVALVVVPLAYVAIDYALSRGLNRNIILNTNGRPPVEALGPFAVALLLLFVAAGVGRVSGLGPLLAAVVWGGVASGYALAAPGDLFTGLRNLPQTYDAFGLGLVTYGGLLFPVVTVLLVGAAVSGRWR